MEKHPSNRLEDDRQAFARWRANRRARQPIPANLWEAALRHVPQLGLSQTAREFRLNYSLLKKKAAAAGLSFPADKRSSIPAALTAQPAAFQEISLPWLASSPWADSARISPGLVLERPDGARLKIEGLLPDLAYFEQLSTLFFRKG